MKTLVLDFDGTFYEITEEEKLQFFVKAVDKITKKEKSFAYDGNILEYVFSKNLDKYGISYEQWAEYQINNFYVPKKDCAKIPLEMLKRLCLKYNVIVVSKSSLDRINYICRTIYGESVSHLFTDFYETKNKYNAYLMLKKIYNIDVVIGDRYSADIRPAEKLDLNTYYIKDYSSLISYLDNEFLGLSGYSYTELQILEDKVIKSPYVQGVALEELQKTSNFNIPKILKKSKKRNLYMMERIHMENGVKFVSKGLLKNIYNLVISHKEEKIGQNDRQQFYEFVKGRDQGLFSKEIEELKDYLPKDATVSFGDLTLQNILTDGEEMYQIDCSVNFYGLKSYLIDLAKMSFCLNNYEYKLYNNNKIHSKYRKLWLSLINKKDLKAVLALESAYWIRMYGYTHLLIQRKQIEKEVKKIWRKIRKL